MNLRVYPRKYRIGGGEHVLPGIRNDIAVLPIVECVAPIAYGYTMDGLLVKYRVRPRDGSKSNVRVKFLSHGYGCTHIGPERILVETSLLLLLQNPVFGGLVVFELGCGAFGFKKKVEFTAWMRPDTPIIYVKIQPRSYPSLRSIITHCNLEGDGCRSEELEYSKVKGRYIELLHELLEKTQSKRVVEMNPEKALRDLRIGVINGASNPSSIIANKTIGELAAKLVDEHGLVVVEGQFSELVPEKVLRLARGDRSIESKLIGMFKRNLTFKQAPEQPEPTPGNIRGGIATLEIKQVMTTLRVPFIEEGLGTSSFKVISLEDMLRNGRKLINAINNNHFNEASRIYEEHVGITSYRRGLVLVESAGYDPMTGNILAMHGVQAIYFTTGLGTPWGSLVPTIKVTADQHAWKRYGGPRGFIDYYIDPSRKASIIHRELKKILLDTINGSWLKHEYNQELFQLEDKDGSRIGWETYNLSLQQLYMRA